MSLRTAALLALVMALQAQAAPRPNIVMLVADDWGFTDVGAFGGEIATPNIDALARRGMRFSNFHVAGSCSPTRAMLLTGVEHHRAGVGNLVETMPREHRGQPGYQGTLSREVVTVATLLRDAGYRTFITGKWNVGNEPYNLPDQRGFERSIVQGDTGSDNWDPAQRYLPHSDRVHWFEDGAVAKMPAEFYSSTWFVDRMIGYLQDARTQPPTHAEKQPFFAYLGFLANHVPLQAPKAFVDKYRGRYKDGWTALRRERRDRAAALGLVPPDTPMAPMSTTADWLSLSEDERAYQQRRMEVYAGMAEAMDHEVGRLVEHLRRSGDYDNTVFVFLSDNGAEGSDYHEAQLWLRTQYSQDIDRLGGKGAYAIMGPGWASAAVAPLSTYKFFGGEGGIRTPLIVAGMNGMPAGRIQAALTHVTDIAPTLLELAAVPTPGAQYRGRPVEPISGHSLVPLLRGEREAVRASDEALGYELSGNLALFKGDLKLVKILPPLGDGQWHLYNLRLDPGETLDLQLQQPEAFRAMQADYADYARTHGVLPMPEGYSATRQVLFNSFANYWIPAYGRSIALAIAALVLGIAGLVVWRKRLGARRAAL